MQASQLYLQLRQIWGGPTYLGMLGLVVDSKTNEDEDDEENKDKQHGTQLQQHVAMAERRRRSRASHSYQRSRRWWPRLLLPIIQQQLQHQSTAYHHNYARKHRGAANLSTVQR